MKHALLPLFVALIVLVSCKTGPSVDKVKQARIDDSIIRVYLSNNPIIKAERDPSGLYYQVVREGSGSFATNNSMVTVNYSGKLINGAPFDSARGYTNSLDALIKGWQIGLQHVKQGGNILLFVPSALAYGSSSAGLIPGNSVLIFDIDLVDHKEP
jgi:FKBP-type peptidyl-prolyl cis-trans isomerase FkpA